MHEREIFPHTSHQQRWWAGTGGTLLPLCLLQLSFPFLCNQVHLAKGLEPALPFQLLDQPSLLGSPYAVVWSAYGEYFYCQACKRHTQWGCQQLLWLLLKDELHGPEMPRLGRSGKRWKMKKQEGRFAVSEETRTLVKFRFWHPWPQGDLLTSPPSLAPAQLFLLKERGQTHLLHSAWQRIQADCFLPE